MLKLFKTWEESINAVERTLFNGMWRVSVACQLIFLKLLIELDHSTKHPKSNHHPIHLKYQLILNKVP